MKKALLMMPLLLLLVSCGNKNSDCLRYELNLDNTYTAILDNYSTNKKVSVPKKHNGKDVTQISGFRNNSYIEEVSLSSNITKIEEGSFTFCENLKKIKTDNPYYYPLALDKSMFMDGRSGCLMVYLSGNTDEKVTVYKNIKSKAFTIAPNIKELDICSIEVEENAIYFLENLETICIEETVKNLSKNFQQGNSKLEKLVINNTKITENLEINNVNKVYVLEDATLSTSFLENYEYKNNDTYNNVTYKVYEVK